MKIHNNPKENPRKSLTIKKKSIIQKKIQKSWEKKEDKKSKKFIKKKSSNMFKIPQIFFLKKKKVDKISLS